MTLSALFRFAGSVLLGFALLSGCCANNICDRDDSKEDLIKLVFARSFSTTDLDTVLIQRYPLIINSNTRPETITLIRSAAQAYDTIVLNTTSPFSQTGSTRIKDYKYVVRYYGKPFRRQPGAALAPAIALIIDQAALKGSFEGNGCCTYYVNTQKLLIARRDSTKVDTTYDLKPRPILIIDKK
jgi:hypothetical protein